MKKSWRPSAAWATDSIHRVITRTRMRLTIFYIGMGIAILLSYTLLLLLFLQAGYPLFLSVLWIMGSLFLIICTFGYILTGLTLRPIQSTLEAQKRFTADVSHNLRTPLTILKTELEVARKESKEKSSQVAFGSSLEEVDRMSRIIDGLLRFSRITTSQEQLRFQRLHYTELVRTILQRMQRYSQDKKIPIHSTLAPDIWIVADPEKIEEAILNILRNSLEYSAPGSKVEVRLDRQPKWAVLCITDQGPGIAEDDLRHIFERFYRSAKVAHSKSGSGLGLPIAHWILQQHHGSIEVKSKLGQGTQVYLSLPVA